MSLDSAAELLAAAKMQQALELIQQLTETVVDAQVDRGQQGSAEVCELLLLLLRVRTAERDAARAVAVSLEQELAACAPSCTNPRTMHPY